MTGIFEDNVLITLRVMTRQQSAKNRVFLRVLRFHHAERDEYIFEDNVLITLRVMT